MKNKSLHMVASTFMAVSFMAVTGCADPADEDATTESTVTGLDGSTSPESDSAEDDAADSMASEETAGMDDASTDATATEDTGTTTGAEGCEDYRMTYPAGPYGVAANSVLEEMPGMVLPDGSATGFADVFADTSKVALLLLNAFDT